VAHVCILIGFRDDRIIKKNWYYTKIMEGIMKLKKNFRAIVFFLGGLITASVFQFIYPPPKDALADQYACIRQDLDAVGMTGNIPDPAFTIAYKVPLCYSSNGYSVEKVYMYGDQVAVKYKNSQPASLNSFNTKSLNSSGSSFRIIP